MDDAVQKTPVLNAIITPTFLTLCCHGKYNHLPKATIQGLLYPLLQDFGKTLSQVHSLLPETHYPSKGLVYTNSNGKGKNQATNTVSGTTIRY